MYLSSESTVNKMSQGQEAVNVREARLRCCREHYAERRARVTFQERREKLLKRRERGMLAVEAG